MVGRFHAVAIHCGGDACAAVKKLKNKHFLSTEAPDLPLLACDHRSECRCRYEFLGARLTDARKESETGLALRIFPRTERRQPGAAGRPTDRARRA